MYAHSDSPVSPSPNLISENLKSVLDRQAFTIPGTAERRERLKRLKAALKKNEDQLLLALATDLGKSEFEAHVNEIGLVHHEINLALGNLGKWTRSRRPILELFTWPGAARMERVPFGNVLIIAPWNFPLMLAFAPLVSALAAGNRAVIKPSELAPASSTIISEIISRTFPDGWVNTVQGGPKETGMLLESGFDFVFFTGSSRVGRIVMEKAAATLTPVVLELGGRNPVVIADDASMKQAARQIAWGKFNNAGQACVAPDHVYVPRHLKDIFLKKIKQTIREFFGENPQESPEFGRIISRDHVQRLEGFLEGQKVVIGGETDSDAGYVSPSVIDSPAPDSPILQEEIFGPILPVIPYDSLEEVLTAINSRPASLARYAFTGSRKTAERIMAGVGYGGGMVNGTTLQFAASALPFGGAGESGMGSAHGRAGFEAFSRPRSIITRPFGLDLPFAYPGRHLPHSFIRKLTG